MKKLLACFTKFALVLCIGTTSALGWDYEGHRLVNQLALDSLPKNFPAFVKTAEAQERIAFLSGEPDRWRNTPDLPLKHLNFPDHFIDIEDLEPFQIDPEKLTQFRYEFSDQLAAARAKNPDKFPSANPEENKDRTKGMVGFLPWTVTEYYGKLKSAFSYLKAYEEHGTPEEIANAQANVIYIMGVMGHFIGDAVQPLHTTKHYNGWVGENPNNYTTSRRFHSWIDGGYLKKVGMPERSALKERLRPAQPLWPVQSAQPQKEVFPTVLSFILDQFKLVEPLYKLEKAGKLSGEGPEGMEGKPFLEGQMLKGGQFLGDLWYSAWVQAPPDTYLRARLIERQLGSASEKPKTP